MILLTSGHYSDKTNHLLLDCTEDQLRGWAKEFLDLCPKDERGEIETYSTAFEDFASSLSPDYKFFCDLPNTFSVWLKKNKPTHILEYNQVHAQEIGLKV